MVLNCSISGFVSNIPDIDYDWTLNDALIPHPHEHFAAAASVHSEAELARNSKFVVGFDGTELSLTVKNPSKLTGILRLFIRLNAWSVSLSQLTATSAHTQC